MVKLYTPKHFCGTCVGVKAEMNRRKIEFENIDNEEDVDELVVQYDIRSMPFAEVDGEILDTSKLLKWIKEQSETKVV